jgi:hypothetical protein
VLGLLAPARFRVEELNLMRSDVRDATTAAVPVLGSAEEQATHAFKPAPERGHRSTLSWREPTVRSNLEMPAGAS